MASPAAEIDIDAALVARLLAAQCPELAALPVEVVANGWDNTIARIGDDWLARLPRRADAAHLVLTEQVWLPQLAPRLPLDVPVPWFCGVADEHYPWAWSVCRWLPGNTAAIAPPTDLAATAVVLASFIEALHQPAPDDAPTNPFRGVSLQRRAQAVVDRAHLLEAIIDTPRVLRTWDELRSTPAWDGPPAWLHGDLHPSNMLTVDGRLSAVIDFGDMCAGDPATDLALAWMMFPPAEREQFRSAVGVDEHTWRRAAGWALNLSLAYMTGDDSTSMPAIGRRTLAAVLAEFEG